jgi:hypothetical protein
MVGQVYRRLTISHAASCHAQGCDIKALRKLDRGIGFDLRVDGGSGTEKPRGHGASVNTVPRHLG